MNKAMLLIKVSKKVKSTSVPCKGLKLSNAGVSCKMDDRGFFVATHRARSRSFKSLSDIPLKTIKFIDSTG